ncbi:MAG: hypothetical protein LUF90_04315 [Rikenellaceae bacterium]|nr:hypothetical protein [Rikenellaceae bacterium]
MRKFGSVSFIFIFILFLYSTFGVSGQESNTAIVDFEAQWMRPLKIADSSVLVLTNDVVFHHNGAIIVCDSAIRYSDRMIECYGNVIINKDSTYIYGDKADYNGNTNLAKVYSPLVKMIDKDVTMYSYNLEFNTLTSVGKYTQGGTITQNDNLMESQEATYYSDDRQVFFVYDVAMRNDEYILQTDSMGYNFDTEITTFYKKAYIWNKDGNFLTADRGQYNRFTDTYTFTENSFIMTEDYQTWADSITFNQTSELSHLYNDIQIIDEEQKVMLFGDYGIYWGQLENAMVTKDPAVVSYDTSEGQDSTFMRSDSIFLYKIFPVDDDKEDEGIPEYMSYTPEDIQRIMDEVSYSDEIVLPEFFPINMSDPYASDVIIDDDRLVIADMQTHSDSVMVDNISIPDSVTIAELPVLTDSISVQEEIETPVVVEKPKTKRELKREEKERKKQEKLNAKRAELLNRMRVQEANDAVEREFDSVTVVTVVDSLNMDPLSLIDDEEEELIIVDSVQRILRAYHNVKIYRNDIQAVCDSLVSFSVDSTMHMYIDPVLWNENNQVTSEIMHFYTENQELVRAEFEIQPLMVEYVLDSLYNQLAGRVMIAHFVDNRIRMLEAKGNAESYYYYQEEENSDYVDGFSVTECSFINFYFDDNKLTEIRWHDDVNYALYPMDKIPENQPQYMRNFKWEEDRRPKSRFEVFNRRIRESIREEMSAIPQPGFTITAEIDEYKINLIDQGIWTDRSEDIWINPEHFLK